MERNPLTSHRLTRLLIPVDGSAHSKKAAIFSSCIAKAMKERIQCITLVHVLAGTHLKEALEKRDIRASEILKSDLLKKLREEHVNAEIRPFLEKEVELLRKMGVDRAIDYIIENGHPAEKIMEVARKRDFSTIIIGRRGLSAMKEFFVGSVTISLINQPGHPTVYIVSETPVAEDQCPLSRILVPVDGSSHGDSALEEAALFLHYFRHDVREVSLLRVIDPARYEERQRAGIMPEEEGREILDAAKKKVMEQGVPEDRIDTVMLYGKPANRILDMAMSRNVNMVFMGKRGRSPLKDLVIGNTATEVIHRLTGAIIVITS